MTSCAYVDVLDAWSSARRIVVPLPRHGKPLAAHVRIHTATAHDTNNAATTTTTSSTSSSSTHSSRGGRNVSTGLLASYYNPEVHAWVVCHRPTHDNSSNDEDTNDDGHSAAHATGVAGEATAVPVLVSSSSPSSSAADACVTAATRPCIVQDVTRAHATTTARTAAAAAVTLHVRVVVLIDRDDDFDVHIAMTRLCDDAATTTHDDVLALQQRSRYYRGHTERTRPRDKTSANVDDDNDDSDDNNDSDDDDAAREAGWLPPVCARACVQLHCTLPAHDAYVLTGGGFVSDYPIGDSAPAMPRSRRALHTAWLQASSSSSQPEHQQQQQQRVDDDDDDDDREYVAWRVTAAANAALTCCAIGVRFRRRRRHCEQQQQQREEQQLQLQARAAHDGRVARHAATRPLQSWHAVDDSTATTTTTTATTMADAATLCDDWLEALTLRQGIRVWHGSETRTTTQSRRQQQQQQQQHASSTRHTWCMQLPPPYRAYTAAFSLRDMCDDAMHLLALAHYYDDDVLDALL